jgi:hypothetical protein
MSTRGGCSTLLATDPFIRPSFGQHATSLILSGDGARVEATTTQLRIYWSDLNPRTQRKVRLSAAASMVALAAFSAAILSVPRVTEA